MKYFLVIFLLGVAVNGFSQELIHCRNSHPNAIDSALLYQSISGGAKKLFILNGKEVDWITCFTLPYKYVFDFELFDRKLGRKVFGKKGKYGVVLIEAIYH